MNSKREIRGDAEAVTLAERGKNSDGEPTLLNERLFVQLLTFSECHHTAPIIEALEASGLPGVLYLDINDPVGVGLLTFDREPGFFVTALRDVLGQPAFRSLKPNPEMTMFGRTYSIGYEQDLQDTLLHRPIRRVTDKEWPWAIWYPLRRAGAFEQLAADQQREILMEHGTIGRAYGQAGYAHDVRLASHGLNKEDEDFVIGLIGRTLHPLSHIVQRMRRTKQTSQYLERLGPFFVGRAIWQKSPTR